METTRSSHPSTAFVLAGGGSLGAVEVGMLQGLVEAGIVPDLVVGASVGAINGVHFAAAPNARGVERLAEIWRRIGRGEVFPFSPIRSIRALPWVAATPWSLPTDCAGCWRSIFPAMFWRVRRSRSTSWRPTW